MATAETSPLVWALAYLGRGRSVIPVEHGGKRPLVGWERFQDAPPAEAELRTWFRHWPDANIGIVTGAVSGIVVIDVDPRHGGDRSLAELTARHGPLPDTSEALTGGSGRHLYFHHPGTITPNRTALAPGIELRGDGGLIVAPPSLHGSGRHYVWRAGHRPDEVASAAMPDWLLRLCRGEPRHGGHPLAYWRALLRDGVDAGARNSTIASLTGHLLFRGVDPDVALELLLCWNRVRCRPPLDDTEVARTVQSITRTHVQQARHLEADGRGERRGAADSDQGDSSA